MDIQNIKNTTRAYIVNYYIINIIISAKKVIITWPIPALLPSWDEVSPWDEVTLWVVISPWDEVSH